MPGDIEDGNEIDRDDRKADIEEVPYAKLMAMLSDNDEDADNGIAFGEGTKETAELPDIVSVEDGIELLDGADQGKHKAKADDKSQMESDPGEDGKKPDGTETKANDDGEAKADAAKAEVDPFDEILSGLDEGKRTAIQERVKGADDVMSLFKGREAELESLGTNPADAMKQLLNINSYARSNPDDYLAWVAGQFGDAKDLISKAAAKIGLKLVTDEGEDDPFEDPQVKELREENRALKAANAPVPLGPDSPQFRIQTEVQQFAASKEHWQTVAPQVAALASAHRETTGQPATMADIGRFYDAALILSNLQEKATTTPSPAPDSQASSDPAAQKPSVVANVGTKTTAAANASVERAKAASKSLDGSGQGASRRPATDPNMPLDAFLSNMYEEQTKG